MSKKVLLTLLFATVPAWGAFPKVTPYQCGQWLGNIVKTSITKKPSKLEMAQPVPEIKLLRPTRPDELSLVWHPLKAVLQFVPRIITNYSRGYAHDIDVLGVINRQYEKYSAKKGKRRQLGWASILLSGIILNIPLLPAEFKFYSLLDDGARAGATDVKIALSWNQWGHLINDDYRYFEIKMLLANHEVSKLEARELAYSEKTQFDLYYKSLKTHRNKTIEEAEHSPLFSNLNNLKLYKLGTTAGFYSVAPGEMSELEEKEIIKLKQDYFLDLEVLGLWVSQGAPTDLTRYSGNLGALLKAIVEKPFVKSLLEMRPILTDHDLQFYIGQDLTDQQNFRIRAILGIIPYQFVDGKLTDQLDITTLEEVRQDTLDTIRASALPH